MLNLRYHLFLVSLLPFIAIHLSLILSIQNDFLDFCNPYIDGCYSISRAARQPYSIIIFKIFNDYLSRVSIFSMAKNF